MPLQPEQRVFNLIRNVTIDFKKYINTRCIKDALCGQVSLNSLVAYRDILTKLGVKVVSVKIQKDKIGNIQLPAIAHITSDGKNYFVVVKDISENEIHFVDEFNKKRLLTKSNFLKAWDGILLLLDKSKTETILNSERTDIQRDVKQFKKIIYGILFISIFFIPFLANLFTHNPVILIDLIAFYLFFPLLIYKIPKYSCSAIWEIEKIARFKHTLYTILSICYFFICTVIDILSVNSPLNIFLLLLLVLFIDYGASSPRTNISENKVELSGIIIYWISRVVIDSFFNISPKDDFLLLTFVGVIFILKTAFVYFKSLNRRNSAIKFNPKVLKVQLEENNKTKYLGASLNWCGNENASVEITAVIALDDVQSRKIVFYLNQLEKRNNKIKYTFIIASGREKFHKRYLAAENYYQLSIGEQMSFLYNWSIYNSLPHLKSSKKKLTNTNELDTVLEWLEMNGIIEIPLILVNNSSISPQYSIDDLERVCWLMNDYPELLRD